MAPRTVRIRSGVTSYRRRKIGVSMQRADRSVHITEDRGAASICLGHQIICELLLGPAGIYHPSGKPIGRPRKETSTPRPRPHNVRNVPGTQCQASRRNQHYSWG